MATLEYIKTELITTIRMHDQQLLNIKEFKAMMRNLMAMLEENNEKD